MTVITVNGVGERHLRAERATLSADIAVAHAGRERSMADATAAHARVAEAAVVLRSTGAATWHSVDVLTTTTRTWTDKDGAKHRDHVTRGTVRIKLARLEMVSDVVAQLSGLGATVSTVWGLTEATKLRTTREMRHIAVRDARGKADDYAAALGARILAVRTVRETPTGVAAGVRGAQGGAHEDLTIPEITVAVGVAAEYDTD